MFGSQKRLIAFVKKELSFDSSNVMMCHCTRHQESLCTVIAAQQCDVKSSVMHRFCQKQGFNGHLFKELLNDRESEYGDLVHQCEV